MNKISKVPISAHAKKCSLENMISKINEECLIIVYIFLNAWVQLYYYIKNILSSYPTG